MGQLEYVPRTNILTRNVFNQGCLANGFIEGYLLNFAGLESGGLNYIPGTLSPSAAALSLIRKQRVPYSLPEGIGENAYRNFRF